MDIRNNIVIVVRRKGFMAAIFVFT